jgi:phosphate starvation-inducible membrane PsiE
MTENNRITELITAFFSSVPMVLYMVVTMMLTIIAIFSVVDAANLIVQMIATGDLSDGLVQVSYALLLTITIIVLFETVTIYFKTKHVDVRALLVAGITGMVRHALIYNIQTVDAATLFATVALLAVLIAGVVVVKPETV